MALSPDAQRAVAVRYQELMASTVENVQSRALAEWMNLGSYNREDIARIAEFSAMLWTQGRTVAVRSASAFNSTITGARPAAIALDTVPGVPPAVDEAFRVVWAHLGDGESWDDAVAAGGEAFAAFHGTGVMQASRLGSQAWSKATGYRGAWQRILTGSSCEWCALVSTQLYHSAASASFGHDRCDCVVAPATEGVRAMQTEMLATLKDQTDIVNRLTVSQAANKTLIAADNAERRSLEEMNLARMAGVRSEDYQRHVDRARQWDRRAHELRVRAAEEATRRISPPETSTGYVDPSGHPASRP